MSHYSETHYRNGEPYLGDTPIRRRWPAGATRRPSPDGRMSDRGNMNARIHVTDNRTPRVIPSRSGTWPPRSEISRETYRYTTGFPNTLLGGASEGSGPASNLNPYRERMLDREKALDWARDHPFERDQQRYKRCGDVRRNENLVNRAKVKENKDPDSNLEAARHARILEDNYTVERDGRQHVLEHYIGYETKKSAAGHREAMENAHDSLMKARRRANRMENDAEKRRRRRGY